MGNNEPNNDSNGSSSRNSVNSSYIKDKIIYALLAFIVGSGGAAGYLNINPPRPDPWTGSDAKKQEARIKQELIELMNLRFVPYEKHLDRADKGWSYIYEMRQDIAIIKEQLKRMEK